MTALILLLSLLSLHHNCCLYCELILGSLLMRNLDWTHFAILSITEEEFTILFRTQTDSLVESRIIQMSSRLCDPSWYLVESFCLAPKAAPGASCPGDRPRVSRLQWMSRNQGTECVRGWQPRQLSDAICSRALFGFAYVPSSPCYSGRTTISSLRRVSVSKPMIHSSVPFHDIETRWARAWDAAQGTDKHGL